MEKKEFRSSNLNADIDDIVRLNTQSDRCHNDNKSYIKTTILQVKTTLVSNKGYIWIGFCLTTINNILNPLGYCLTKVLNETLLTSVDKITNTLSNVTWKSINLTATLLDKVYQKGVTLSDEVMK